jgi:hypothetical protein
LDQPVGLQNATELWADIEASIDEIEAFQQGKPVSNQTFYAIGRDLSSSVVHLSGCERVALWSLSPG